jgi:transcription antitermination protein NusB
MQNEPNLQLIDQTIKPMNPIARRNARRYALQAMYQWLIAESVISDIEAEFLQRIDRPVDLDYFKELIYGIPREQVSLDSALQPYLGRPLDEIDPVELIVLRLAAYELLFRLDVPSRVVINEALELAKKFGSIEGYKFVNGVLDRVARQHRSAEF